MRGKHPLIKRESYENKSENRSAMKVMTTRARKRWSTITKTIKWEV